jgi:hypothetical protein
VTDLRSIQSVLRLSKVIGVDLNLGPIVVNAALVPSLHAEATSVQSHRHIRLVPSHASIEMIVDRRIELHTIATLLMDSQLVEIVEMKPPAQPQQAHAAAATTFPIHQCRTATLEISFLLPIRLDHLLIPVMAG